MANQWFRLYAEFMNDPKVQMMSEVMQRRLIMLFCARCNGDVTLQDDEVVFLLRISPEEWTVTKREFISRKFIDDDNTILNWDKRQFRSDSSAERVSKHREKKKQECNVTVTPPEQNRTEQIQNREEKKKRVAAPEKPGDVSKETWETFLRQRKTKFSTIALEGIRREAEEAGYSVEQALKVAIERGWQSFKSDWVKGKPNGKSIKSAYDITAEIAAEYRIDEPENGLDTDVGRPKLQHFQ